MGKGFTWRGLVVSILTLAFVIPGQAAPTIDTDSAPIFLHILGLASVLAFYKRQQIEEWLRGAMGFRTNKPIGFLFATLFALLCTPFTVNLLGPSVPRFNDAFLIGVVVTCYFFTWEAAVYLLILSVLASAWALPPHGALRVAGFNEWYRLTSFTLVSAFLIVLITRIKTRRPVDGVLEQGLKMHAAAGGD